ncbi:MAG TPA: heavy metal-binding domain-containing protein, partial [Rhizobacter sp.]|nr:heavy metal-binding domain-containing protein [Rhizobacter sp.]
MNTRNRQAAFAAVTLVAGVALGWSISQWRGVGQRANDGVRAEAGPAAGSAAGDRKVLYWYDPMSPAQKFDKPGKSPFMDMQLVPRYADEVDAGASPGLAVSTQAQQALGLRLARVERRAIGASA